MRTIRPALLAALLALALPASAKLVEEIVDIPVTVRNMYGLEVTHPIKLTIWRDSRKAKQPFLVLNHGRAGKAEERAKLGRARYTDNSKYFVSKGFAVFVLTRVGYGVTAGEDVEDTGACRSKNYPPGYEAAAEQSLRVIDYARRQSYVDPARGIAVGQSFGGTTAVALAAKNVPGLVATVNFAGGGGGDPVAHPERPCREDLLRALFSGYGPTARVPTLWLYSENDKYWGKDYPRAWFEGFVKHGGKGEFVMLPPLLPPKGEDGHSTFTRDPEVWREPFEQFLKKNGF